ncbi:FAD-binding oxidoreductase [Litorilinea aerophila]|uniref:FAD-binding oxidoreductase n=1 Tax=Litorilinea aerophila TaxID=1204385 RepID=A0A540V9W2_9CHLR|nr:FAD-binding oxidoreductase [Litorilinea aerophila]MCC9078544.1 FAD-binding oxidoreductase [Litorilinea aerophila]OUC04893.1 alkylglycerone-phosphate synthase [Litorilinea aerophila]
MDRDRFWLEMVRSELEDIVGAHFINTDESNKLIYSTDWSWMPQMWLDRGRLLMGPDFIVHPGSTEEIAQIMEVANKYRIPVIPWGGGSGTQGGALPLFGGILVDMKRMNRILEIDEVSLTVTAEAGINGQQLEWALNERGLTLPHYPASANCATLGGYLAPRGTGTISTKYGKAEDMVLSMEIVLPTGEIIETPPVPRHAAGPHWMGLWLGAEGTFGIITKATMQVDYLPESRRLRAVLFRDLSKGIEAGRQIMTRRLHPFVIRLYDPASTALRVKAILGYEFDGAYMVLGFDGDPDIATLEEEKALALCAKLGGEDLGPEPGWGWWHHRYDFYYPPKNLKLPWMYGTTETISTYDKIERLYWAEKEAVETTYADWNIRFIGHFSHWFHWGAMLYSRFIVENPPQEAEEALRLHNRIWSTAMEAVLANGGMINEHHGVGLKLARYMRRQYGSAWPFLLRLKKAIDPNGIMNPGKVGFGF